MRRINGLALLVLFASQLVGLSGAAEALSENVRVSAGVWHTCSLKARAVRCWGDDSYGQSSVPFDFGSGSVAQIAAGWYHTCALTDTGSVRCWGRNDYGQASPPANLPTVTQVAAGLSATCAIDLRGGVHCWGDNRSGQLNVPSLPAAASKIELGSAYACALTATHLLRCWGYENFPSSPWGDTAVADFDAGSEHACAMGMSGEIRCWGLVWDGENQTTPPGTLSSAYRIDTAGYHTCALTTGQTVSCWGRNSWGQTDVPRGMAAVDSLALGVHHTCVVTTANGIRCWGLNDRGQATVPSDLAPSGPVQMPGTSHWYQLVDQKLPWVDARNQASTMLFRGMKGHLATVTSAAEQQFITDQFNGRDVYLGALDTGPSGGYARNWTWAVGPEAGMVFTRCTSLDRSSSSCATVPGTFSAWIPGSPDNFLQSDYPQLYLHVRQMYGYTNWDDVDIGWHVLQSQGGGFLVEFESLVPSTPGNVKAIASNESAVVNWEMPSNTDASPADSFIVTASPSGKTCETTSRSCSIIGLTNRQTYSFTVTALNAAGESSRSAPSAAVMPLALGFQAWSDDSVLALGSSTTLKFAQSAASASIAVTGAAKATVAADSAGFASSTFTAAKAGIQKFTAAYSVKVGKKTTKYTATTQLYVPSLSGPMLKIKQGKTGKFSLQFMPPGAAVSIALSDGRTVTGTADSGGKASFTPTFNTLGAVTYTASVAGVQIGTGGLTVTR